MSEILSGIETLPEAFEAIAQRLPERRACGEAIAGKSDVGSRSVRVWRWKTFSEARRRVRALAWYLEYLGFKKGDRAAIFSYSRPEWMEADLGVLILGGISVSIYQTLPADVVAYILFDSGSEVVFAENQEQVDKLLEICSKPFVMPGHEDRAEMSIQVKLKKIISFEQTKPDPLVVPFSEVFEMARDKGPVECPMINGKDVAALVYTSGTTGPPKGVVQTHANHLANVRQAFASGLVDYNDSLFLFLPLAHSFAKLMGYIGYLTPVEICFPAIMDRVSSKLNKESIAKDMREARATIHPVVPRLLEKMKEGICEAASGRGLKAAVIRLGLYAASARYSNLKAGRKSPAIGVLFFLTKPVRDKIRRELFGSRFRYAISGGAKLPEDVGEFFDSLDMEVLEGYGLTETCVATNVCRPGKKIIGTVGPVLADNIELKIAQDGEICFRGPNVASGYYQRPTATRGVWDDEGWFYTGDLGEVDEEGNLRIVGRKKEIIVTSGGKNIAPHIIEGLIQESPLVSQAVLVGEARKYCVALVSLEMEQVQAWANKNGIVDDGKLHENEELYQAVWGHVQEINKQLASYETVKRIHIVPDEFTVDNGQMTPTFKVRRGAVLSRYQEEIDKLYK